MSGDDDAGFSELLLALRQDRGLTQEELAHAAGLSVRALREMERGRVRIPQRRTVELLADVLRLDDQQRARFLAVARPLRTARAEALAPQYALLSAPSQRMSQPDLGCLAPAQLPAALGDLTGRGPELARITAHAAEVAAASRTTATMVAVHGPPGVGKTSLAVLAGDRVRDHFADGQLFVDLRGNDRTPVGPAAALAGFLRSLGVGDEQMPASASDRTGLFRTLTRQLALLVVLDNAAHEAQVRPLLPAGPRCLVLVTSRRPLTGLESVDRIALGMLSPADSGRLLGAIVGERRVAAEPAEIHQLSKLCGQLPLALRIAGNRLASRPQWEVRHLVNQLRDQRERLALLAAGDLGVRAAFEVSYRQLDPAAAAMFRCAALIPGADFGADLAAAASGCHVSAARSALEELVDAGLLLTAGVRYGFHDLVRLYAVERLDAEAQTNRQPAEGRMTTWLLVRTAEAGSALSADLAPTGDGRSADPAEARAWLEQEATNWLTALRVGLRLGRHDEVIAAARALHWYSDSATHRHPWEEVYGIGVKAAGASARDRDEVVLLNFYGWALFFCQERYAEATAAHQRALARALELGDRREEAWALLYLAAIAGRTGQPEKSVALSGQAVALFGDLRYPMGRDSARSVLGSGLAALGRYAEALELHRAVLASYRRRGAQGAADARVGEPGAILAVGQDLEGLGRDADATRSYAQARELFQRNRTPFGEALAAYRQGVAKSRLGQRDAATASLRQAIKIFTELGVTLWQGRAIDALASLPPGRQAAAGTPRRPRSDGHGVVPGHRRRRSPVPTLEILTK